MEEIKNIEAADPGVEQHDLLRERRIKRLMIKPEIMTQLFVGNHIVQGRLPEGVQICNASFNQFTRMFVLLIMHPSFEQVPEDKEFPEIPPEMATVTVRSPKAD